VYREGDRAMAHLFREQDQVVDEGGQRLTIVVPTRDTLIHGTMETYGHFIDTCHIGQPDPYVWTYRNNRPHDMAGSHLEVYTCFTACWEAWNAARRG
jgi:hypothetical protein